MRKNFGIAVFVFVTALQADPALITCEDLAGADYYYCFGAPKAVPRLIDAVMDTKTGSTQLKDIAEILTNLNAKSAIPTLKKRVSSAGDLDFNYDRNPVTRQDAHYAARALLELEGNDAYGTVAKYLSKLGDYEFGGSAWEDTLKTMTRLRIKGSGEYAKKIIARCAKKPTDCEVLLPFALDLAISADAKALVPDFAKIKVDNKEIVTSNGEATIHGKRMLLGDKALRKWFRDEMLPKVRYWRENGGGLAFPVVHPDRYLEGARDSADMEIHAAMALGPYPEEAVASLESILYFLDHPGEYGDHALVKTDLLGRVGREASIAPQEMEDKKAKNIFDVFMKAQGGKRDLRYRQVLLRYGDAKAGQEILNLFEAVKSDPAAGFAWIAAGVTLLEQLPVKPASLDTLIHKQLSGEGDGKAVEHVMNFVDIAATRMKSDSWSALMLDGNVYIRDRTLYNLSRVRPKSYCDIVEKEIKARAKKLNHPEIYDALFAMTIYDGACDGNLKRLAKHGNEQARTVAEKVLAALAR